MWLHISSKSETHDSGDLLVKIADISILDLVAKNKKDKKVYFIKIEVKKGIANLSCHEAYDDEVEARKRLAELIKLTTGQNNAEQIALTYKILDEGKEE